MKRDPGEQAPFTDMADQNPYKQKITSKDPSCPTRQKKSASNGIAKQPWQRSTLQQPKATLSAVSRIQEGSQQQSIIPTKKLGITSTPAERTGVPAAYVKKRFCSIGHNWAQASKQQQSSSTKKKSSMRKTEPALKHTTTTTSI